MADIADLLVEDGTVEYYEVAGSIEKTSFGVSDVVDFSD